MPENVVDTSGGSIAEELAQISVMLTLFPLKRPDSS